jgi:hypothetical protein
MPSQSRDKRPTTPKEEGIELHPDAAERFEEAARKFIDGVRVRPAAKPTAEDQPQKRGARARAKRNG